MTKTIFKPLLLAFYCTSKWLVNKKMPQNLVPSTILTFSFPFTFIATGIFCMYILERILNTVKSPIVCVVGVLLFISPVYYFSGKIAKNGIHEWGIEKDYKFLTKNERINKIVTAFIFFWGAFIFQFWLANIAISSM
ncbi:hypothetical protein [Pseudotamlana agarivorans]|uniref:hypothetical protein n=1 Tax=Pseudotamlana agarivorans TaxID=481183 RepID=UPI0012FC3014|nr:hypothetical protein [Tamlana agarivorans]